MPAARHGAADGGKERELRGTNDRTALRRPIATVPPDGYGTAQWIKDREPLLEVGAKRAAGTDQTAEQWADDYLRQHADKADLRALGYCGDCGSPGKLQQVGRCVYWSSCDHYRAQGELRKMQPWLDARLAAISPERREALLALLPR